MFGFLGRIFGGLGSIPVSSGSGSGVDNYLMESGDNLLMEDGSVYLLE